MSDAIASDVVVKGYRLPHQQAEFCEHMARGLLIEEAADAVAISEQTGRIWMTKPHIRQQIDNLREAMSSAPKNPRPRTDIETKAEGVVIRFGALSPKFSEQPIGALIPKDDLKHFQLDADAITRLKVRGILPVGQADGAYRRLAKVMTKAANATDGRARV
jgi:hypothetical protein